jgi:ABC-type branched-subunit amino acid transport system ATPase component
VHAVGLSVRGPRGPVFENVSLDVAAGGTLVVVGPAGSGRTALLLALAGRMRLATGGAAVGPHRLPAEAAAVREGVALASGGQALELDEYLTVGDHLQEWRMSARGDVSALDAALELLAPAGLPLHRRSDEITPRERLALQLALAVADLPSVIVVDDLDAGAPRDLHDELWQLVRRVGELGITVLASASEAPSRTAGADLSVVALPQLAAVEPGDRDPDHDDRPIEDEIGTEAL